ncbi:hypothetical protein [Methanobrevibacter arboriphilus]|nr:hypothetical protein [Methanobrevibacter arboriphilus]
MSNCKSVNFWWVSPGRILLMFNSSLALSINLTLPYSCLYVDNASSGSS